MTPGATPRIVFRADASLEIGTGHVMRCLALADELRRRDAACEFVCRELPGHRADEIRHRGFDVHVLPPPTNPHGWLGVPAALDEMETRAALGDRPVDALVVDHYGLDAAWEAALRPAVNRIMVIDDLADRPHECDVLLDQNLGRLPGDYEGRVPAWCTLLCGAEFALLRPEFAALRPRSLERRDGGGLRSILVTLGGIDKDNATGRVLAVLGGADLPQQLVVTVVMGSRAPWLENVQAQVAELPFRAEVVVDVDDMAQRMAASDFAIGAAGTTSWERCCMGLPSALAVLADNQAFLCRELAAAGAAFDLGAPEVIEQTLPPILVRITSEPTALGTMSAAAAAVCDGRGTTRVADALLGGRGE